MSFPKPFKLVAAAWALQVLLAAPLVIVWTARCGHAQNGPTEDLHSKYSRETIDDLIRQLGASRFRDRELATMELIKAGVVAVDALQQAIGSHDREVSRRAELAIVEIAKLDRPRRLTRFQRGLPTREGPFPPLFDIPGMSLVFSIAGDTTDSRKLLASALQRDWDFCEALLGPTPQAERMIDAKCAALRLGPYAFAQQATLPGDVVAILLGAVRNPEATSDSTAIQVYGLINQLEYSVINPSDHADLWRSPAFRRLVGEFIARCEGPTATYQGLNLSLRYNLPEGLRAAERVLRDPQSLPFVRQYAILAVARFGNDAHIPDLSRMIDDHQICFTRRAPLRHANFECQIRDLALASMLHLLGRDPRQFGFVHLQRSDHYVFQPHTVGFESEEERALALLQFQLSTLVPRSL